MLLKKIGKASLAITLLALTVSPMIAQRRRAQKTHQLRVGEGTIVSGVVREGQVRRHVLRIGPGGGQLNIGKMKLGFSGYLRVISPTSGVLATSPIDKGVHDVLLPTAGDYQLEVDYERNELIGPALGQYHLKASLERKTIVLGNDPEFFKSQLGSWKSDRYVIRINRRGRLLIEDIKTNFSGELVVRERRDLYGDPSGGTILLTSAMNAGSADVLIPREGEYILSVRNKPESASSSAPTSASGEYMFMIRLVND